MNMGAYLSEIIRSSIEAVDDGQLEAALAHGMPEHIALKRIVKFRYQTIPCHRRNVIWRDNNQCQYCAKHFMADKLTIDHVVPRSRGGKNNWLNLVTACKKCNQKKGDKTPSEANMPLIREPKVPKSDIFKNISKNQIVPRWKYYLW